MRKLSLILTGLAAFALAVGCSTTEETDNTPASGGSAGGAYTPEGNNVPISESEACELLSGAFDFHTQRLNCTTTMPVCPDYLRKSGAPFCAQYDEGTVKGCSDFYATFTACSEFQQRPCHIFDFANSAPNGCEPDAGPDAEPDADVEPDAEADAMVEPDAEPDTGLDATEPDVIVPDAADATTD